MQLTEDYISRQLNQSGRGNGPAAQSYSEIDSPDEARLKCAAVLIPLLRHQDDWQVLFTRRTHLVESHKGQVSFPGGACEQGELTPDATALREAEEEIGIDQSQVRVLGTLASMITISSFRVTPVVGVVGWPAVFRVAGAEVERLFTIPLLWLADTGHRWEFPLPGRNGGLIAFHPFDGELVWGATARIMADFLKVLGI